MRTIGYLIYVLLFERIESNPGMMRVDDYRGRYASSVTMAAFGDGFTPHT